jgi:hypothetical protein
VTNLLVEFCQNTLPHFGDGLIAGRCERSSRKLIESPMSWPLERELLDVIDRIVKAGVA